MSVAACGLLETNWSVCVCVLLATQLSMQFCPALSLPLSLVLRRHSCPSIIQLNVCTACHICPTLPCRVRERERERQLRPLSLSLSLCQPPSLNVAAVQRAVPLFGPSTGARHFSNIFHFESSPSLPLPAARQMRCRAEQPARVASNC